MWYNVIMYINAAFLSVVYAEAVLFLPQSFTGTV